MKIEIDQNAGFCFGVKRAIKLAEDALKEGNEVFCLGQIVHNQSEEKRLMDLGMKTISHSDLLQLKNKTVLIRAHGEAPSTYDIAAKNNLHLIEATCPIVLSLQQKIKTAWLETSQDNRQIVIVGKKQHPETIGLAGQTHNEAIIAETPDDIKNIDSQRPVYLFAQTTISEAFFEQVKNQIIYERNSIASEADQRYSESEEAEETSSLLSVPAMLSDKTYQAAKDVFVQKSICNHVRTRRDGILEFAKKHDVVVLVSGKNSSNGQYLYELCRTVNKNSFFIQDETMLQPQWFEGCKSAGISGATSTPPWLLEKVAEQIKKISM